MGASAEPGRSTASRLLAVLGAFDQEHPVMNLTRLSTEAGLPIATAYRLANELMGWGAIERNEDGSYQVGVKLWELGSLAPRQRDLRLLARPIMEGLHEATGQTVQLAVLDGKQALCLEKISGSRSATNVTEVARRLPLHATGVGKVILAFSDPELLARLARGGLKPSTNRTIVMPGMLDQNLSRIRRERVGYCREEMTLGTSSVAAPITDGAGKFIASLGVLTKSTTDLSRLAPAVRTAALSISRRLASTVIESARSAYRN